MKTTTTAIFAAGTILLASPAVQSFAIEGLQLTVQCPDVILGWPSQPGETFIVQWRPDLNSSTSWTTLTNSLPADWGSYWTSLTDSNRAPCAVAGTNNVSGGGGGPPPLPGFAVAASSTPLASEIMVIPADGSGSAIPLCIYPPGFDLTGYILIDPTGQQTSGAGHTIPLPPISGAVRNSPQPMDDDPGGGGSPPDPGFYRVVRNGVHLFGVTNGMVLSGQVPLPFEFGIADTNRTIDQVYVTDNDSDADLPGSSFLAFPLPAGESPAGVWDTTQATNGNYLLQLGALLDDGTVFMDIPIAVTVSNLICQPDPWNVGGQAIYVGFKTVFTSGTWHLDAYDSDNSYIGFLEGYIDTDGYCNYPGIAGPGFSVNNTDPNGNQYPSPSYTLVMTAMATGSIPPYPIATNKVFIEPAWNYYTRAVTCYEQVFESWKEGANDVRLLMEAVWGAEEIYHQNQVGGITTVHEVDAQGWGPVTNALANLSARDFVYFGHGSGRSLANGGLTITMVQTLLGNNLKDPLTATNLHPYRYVFLDGCNAADGDWPQAFGIPKKQGMVITDFTDKRGIRPRAFMGWNRKKAVGTRIFSGAQLYPPHSDYITRFWDYWTFGNTGLRPVKDAIQQAATRAPLAADGMTLYGAQDLVVNY